MDTEHEFKEEFVVNDKTYHVEGRVRKWNPVQGYEDQVPKGLVCEVRCMENDVVAWASTKERALARLRFAVKLNTWFTSDEAKPYRENRDLLHELWKKDPKYTYAGVTQEELDATAKDEGLVAQKPLRTYGAKKPNA